MTSGDERLQVASLDMTGVVSMLSERLGVEVTQECIQDVWVACSWQQKEDVMLGGCAIRELHICF